MKRLTILVISVDGVGHVNSCAGTLEPFLKRGHRVIFLIDEAFRGKLAARGYEEHVAQISHGGGGKNAGDNWAVKLVELKVLGPYSVEEKYRATIDTFLESDFALSNLRRFNERSKEAIELYKPDLVVIDASLPPAVYNSGIPWVNNMSCGPLLWGYSESDDLPPPGSGFASNAPQDTRWNNFKEMHKLFQHSQRINNFIEKELNYPRYPEDKILPDQEALITVYAYPEEINYPAIRDKKNWFNLEVFNKGNLKESAELKELVPVEFIEKTLDGKWSGKWVYLSLGSMGAADLSLMARILEAVSETRHKYIVSKGPLHNEYELPANAWGDRYLPQTRLIPLMDAVITHGGNNTTTETFAQGKPMLVLPLFGDQYDNAQRLQETGLGLRLDPYEFEKHQLIEAVDKLLNNEQLNEKLRKASERILADNRHEQFVDKVEQLWLENRQNGTA